MFGFVLTEQRRKCVCVCVCTKRHLRGDAGSEAEQWLMRAAGGG